MSGKMFAPGDRARLLDGSEVEILAAFESEGRYRVRILTGPAISLVRWGRLIRVRDITVPVFPYLVPAPVRTVLRQGYTVKQHLIECEVRPLIWCRIPYSPELGLLTGEEDDEF